MKSGMSSNVVGKKSQVELIYLDLNKKNKVRCEFFLLILIHQCRDDARRRDRMRQSGNSFT